MEWWNDKSLYMLRMKALICVITSHRPSRRKNPFSKIKNPQADTQVFMDKMDVLRFHCGLWIVWFVGRGTGGGIGE